MIGSAVTLVVLAGLGLAGGWWLGGRGAAHRRRALHGLLGLAALPLAALLLAGLIGSDTLGWVAGLTLMAGLAGALPVLAGAAIGWLLARLTRRQQLDGTPAPVAAPAPDPEPAPPIRATPAPQPGVLLIMAGVAAGFVAALSLGFRLHGQVAPGVLQWGLWPALGVLLLLTVPAGRWLVGQVRRHDARRRADALHRSWQADREQWLRQLAADPRRQPYLARIGRGEHWTPERVDYDLDPDALVLCPHLQPVERALRRAGVQVLPIGAHAVQATCVLDPGALARRFTLPGCVSYSEPLRQDRQGDSEPSALLRCARCESQLWPLHARQAEAGTPRFPDATNK